MAGQEFKITVPYNHPMMVAQRKHEKMGSIFAYLFMMVVALAIGAFAASFFSPYVWIAFGAFAAVMLILIVRKILKGRPTPSDADKNYYFYFHEDGLKISIDDMVLNSCSYNNQGTQYVMAVFDVADRWKIQLVTGEVRNAQNNMKTRNIYMFYSIPKDTLAAGEAAALKEFLQAKLGKKRYKVK